MRENFERVGENERDRKMMHGTIRDICTSPFTLLLSWRRDRRVLPQIGSLTNVSLNSHIITLYKGRYEQAWRKKL
jgi:hypothetical protein